MTGATAHRPSTILQTRDASVVGQSLAWIGLGALLTAGIAPVAQAQVSASATLATDYRLRGVSLTDRRAALSADLTFDTPSGVYAGGSVLAEDNANLGARLVGHSEFLGVAGRGPSGLGWDLGLSNLDMSLVEGRHFKIAYQQVYFGLSQKDMSARLSLAPDYPRRGISTAYLDLNGVVHPSQAWRITGHLGIQTRLGPWDGRAGRRERYDVRLGLIRGLPRGELNLAVTSVVHRPQPQTANSGTAITAGATLFF